MSDRRPKVAIRSSTQPQLQCVNDEASEDDSGKKTTEDVVWLAYASNQMAVIKLRNAKLLNALQRTADLTNLLVQPAVIGPDNACAMIRGKLNGFMGVENIDDMIMESLKNHEEKKFRKWMFKWCAGVLRPNKQGFCTWGKEATLNVLVLLLRHFVVSEPVQLASDELIPTVTQEALNNFLDSFDNHVFIDEHPAPKLQT